MRASPKPTVHTITTEFEDNNNEIIPLEIEYHRIGAWGHHEICEVNIKVGEYLCDRSDLEWESRRLIRDDVKKNFAYYAEFDDISIVKDFNFLPMPDHSTTERLVAEHEGWKIYEQLNFGYSQPRYIATNDGQGEAGDSIEDVVQQIASRVGELNRKEGAWSGEICENN